MNDFKFKEGQTRCANCGLLAYRREMPIVQMKEGEIEVWHWECFLKTYDKTGEKDAL